VIDDGHLAIERKQAVERNGSVRRAEFLGESAPSYVAVGRQRRPLRRAVGYCLRSLAILVLSSGPALAYVGPGAGLSAVGSLLALVAAIAVAAAGFLWFPIKRLVRRCSTKPARRGADTTVSKT
jgi:hypothetical protein